MSMVDLIKQAEEDATKIRKDASVRGKERISSFEKKARAENERQLQEKRKEVEEVLENQYISEEKKYHQRIEEKKKEIEKEFQNFDAKVSEAAQFVIERIGEV